MIRRLFRSLMMLLALVVAYQAYLLLAVPWLDPPLVSRDERARARPQRGDTNPVTKYQRLLAHYFPAEHWSLLRAPIVLSTGTTMLVLDDYKRQDDGRVEIERCAILVFPTPLADGVAPPNDAIIVEYDSMNIAGNEAKLQFDDGFRPERGQLGQITRGEFPGKVTIRSRMRSPGPEDDLLVETSDLSMNSKLLFTSNPVRFRMGPNVGGGRELEIRFLEDEHPRPSSASLKIAGVASLEVRREVRMRLFLETDSLLPGSDGKKKAKGEIRRLPAATEVATTELSSTPPLLGTGSASKPVEVTCTGPFYFDLVQYVASFDRNVELRQINPDGPSDQLSAQKLDIRFTPRGELDGRAERSATDAARRQKDDLGRLQASFVIAQGHPVVVVSPARGAEARGEQIELGLEDQTLKITGGQDVRLVYGPNVLRAPVIDYQQPPNVSGSKIGTFKAAGPGTLHYVLDPAKPDQVFVAAWQKSVEMARHEGQPMIVLAGRPQISAGNLGRIAADEMRVNLRETSPDAAQPGLSLSGSSGKSGENLGVLLNRVTATGNVQIESPELSGRTERLVASFRYPEQAGASPYAVPSGAEASNPNAAPQFELAANGSPPGQAYYIESDEIRLEATMNGNRAVPDNLTCNGHVLFREIASQAANEEPLQVRGEQLVASNLAAAARISIRGSASAYSAAGNAELRARGMTLLAPTVELDAGQSRLWIEAPGTATMMVTRALGGQAAATPYPMEIRWQGGLNFDGRYITFERDILVRGDDAWLRCDRMAAKLTAPVEFGKSVNQTAIDLEEIDCQGHVVLDQRSRDAAGPTSHQRLQLPRLVINQQTGVISGEGPGVVRSTHFADQMNALGGAATARTPAATGAVAPPPGFERPRLHFLRIDFHRGLAGNLITRELVFKQRVRTVYGPVDSWEQELDHRQAAILPPDTVLIACDELSVSEDPLAARPAANAVGATGQQIGPVQLVATRNVRIDGQHETHGTFGAQADRASYEQSKDTFLIEGTVRTPAMLWQKRNGGAVSTPLYALKIWYNLATGKPKVGKAQYIEITSPQAAPQNARGPAPILQ